MSPRSYSSLNGKQIESLAEVYRQLILSHYRNFGIVNKLDAIIIPKGSLDNKPLELAIYKIPNQEVKVISPINKDDRKRPFRFSLIKMPREPIEY